MLFGQIKASLVWHHHHRTHSKRGGKGKAGETHERNRLFLSVCLSSLCIASLHAMGWDAMGCDWRRSGEVSEGCKLGSFRYVVE